MSQYVSISLLDTILDQETELMICLFMITPSSSVLVAVIVELSMKYIFNVLLSIPIPLSSKVIFSFANKIAQTDFNENDFITKEKCYNALQHAKNVNLSFYFK